jgi:hypothetical protein
MSPTRLAVAEPGVASPGIGERGSPAFCFDLLTGADAPIPPVAMSPPPLRRRSRYSGVPPNRACFELRFPGPAAFLCLNREKPCPCFQGETDLSPNCPVSTLSPLKICLFRSLWMAEREKGQVQYMGWNSSGTGYRYGPAKGMFGFYVG